MRRQCKYKAWLPDHHQNTCDVVDGCPPESGARICTHHMLSTGYYQDKHLSHYEPSAAQDALSVVVLFATMMWEWYKELRRNQVTWVFFITSSLCNLPSKLPTTKDNLTNQLWFLPHIKSLQPLPTLTILETIPIKYYSSEGIETRINLFDKPQAAHIIPLRLGSESARF